MSNGGPGEKMVDLGPDQSGVAFQDFLGHRVDQVTTDEAGKAVFATNGGSVSVWVRSDQL